MPSSHLTRAAWSEVQKTRGKISRRLVRAPNVEVVVYPNVITVRCDHVGHVSLTPEQWAEMVEFVGITGFAPESTEIIDGR